MTECGIFTPPCGAITRRPRCRVLDRLANRCPNEQLSDYGFCLKHLAGAHAEFEALLTEAKLRHPSARVAGRRR